MVSYQNILQARDNIAGHVAETELVDKGHGEDGSETYLKLEHKHAGVGAFKKRGACNALVEAVNDGRFEEAISKGDISEVVTAAIGSHGFAIGHFCRGSKNLSSTCYMPDGAPSGKKITMERAVDNVVYVDGDFRQTEEAAKQYADNKGHLFIHPYNDERVIAGQGTIGLEIYDQLPDVANVYVPVGGGGLISGIAIALKELKPDVRIVGVQSENMHAMAESFKQGRITEVPQATSFAEPLCVNLNPEAITFGYVNELVDEFMLVGDGLIRYTQHDLYGHDLAVEGAATIALAAAEDDPNREGKSVCIVTGQHYNNSDFFGIMCSAVEALIKSEEKLRDG
jgi:threonine dehydratase